MVPIRNCEVTVVVPCNVTPAVLDTVVVRIFAEATCPNIFGWWSFPFLHLPAVARQTMFGLQVICEAFFCQVPSIGETFHQTGVTPRNRSVATCWILLIAN